MDPAAREKELNKIREKAFKTSIKDGKNPRMGLYSYAPFSIGDNTYTKTYKIVKGEDGQVVTQPRQIYPGPLQTGQQQSTFFSRLASNAIGDPYLNRHQQEKIL